MKNRSATQERLDLEEKLSAMLLAVAEKHPRLQYTSWIGISAKVGTFSYKRVIEADYTPVGAVSSDDDDTIIIYRSGNSVAYGLYKEEESACLEMTISELLADFLLPGDEVTTTQDYLVKTLVENVEKLLE